MKENKINLFSAIIFFVFCWLGAASQPSGNDDTSAIKSLKQDLLGAIDVNDSLQMARTYRRIGVEYMFASMYGQALDYLQHALQVAEALQHQRAIAAIYNNIADCYSKQGLRDKALAIYDTIGDIYLAIPDSIAYSGMLMNLSAEYQEMGDNATALETAFKALRIKEETKDSTQIAFFYVKIAELLENTQQDSHRKWLQKAWELSINPAYTTFYTNLTIYNNMARLYREDGDYDRAIALYDTVYIIASQYDHHDGMEVGLANLASLYAQLGDIENALQTHKLALEIAEKGQNVFRRTGHAVNAGKLEITLGNYNSALELLNKGLDLAINYDFPEYKISAMEALSRIYRYQEKWKDAYDSYYQFSLLKDSIDGVKVKETILELEQKFETEKKQQQIELLEAKNLSNLRQQRMLVLLLVFSIIVFAGIIWLVRLRNRKLRQQKELAEQKREIYRLNQENLKLSVDQKNRELSSLAMQMAQRSGFLSDLKEKLITANTENILTHIKSIENQIKNNTDWDAFRLHFEDVHPSFFKKLLQKYPELTPNEQKLCAFLAMNLTSKEISNIHSNTVAAVDKSRNRLRKKMNISPDQSIRDFLLGLI